MTNRIMLHAHANENTIKFRTVGTRMKSPQSFYVTYSELTVSGMTQHHRQ